VPGDGDTQGFPLSASQSYNPFRANMTDERIQKAVPIYLAQYRQGDQQPSFTLSSVDTVNEKCYIVLRNIDGILAVYRHMKDGSFKHMVRWPKQIQA
jgi:hypothetical protein